MSTGWEIFIVVWLLCAIGCAMIASSKQLNVGNWFFAGLILGILGLIMVAVADKKDPNKQETDGQSWKCPKCGFVNSYWVENCQNRIITYKPYKNEACNQPRVIIQTEKKCPDCAELVKIDAKVCRFCGYKFVPADEQKSQ